MAGAFGSTELLCVQAKKATDGWFVYGVLKLASTVRQLNPVSTGSTHPRVSRKDILDLMVPWMDDAEQQGALLEAAQSCYFSANRLALAAELLVYALIERRIDETELVCAQEALNRGDSGPDRAILGRLTRKGINAPEETPLFPDLDALDETIAKTLHDQEGDMA